MTKSKLKPKKWPRRDLILLFERLELYISSGLALNKALAIAADGIPKKQRETILQLQKIVESGGTLSRALTRAMRVSPAIVGLIEHGESSGQLGKAFGHARSLLEREDELVKKCTGAMAYPLIIGVFALVLTVGLVKGVMPQIIPMLKNLHVKLPLLTRIVMSFSENMTAYGIYIVCTIGLIGTVLSISYKKSKSVRGSVQTLLSHIPLVGRLTILYFCSLLIRSLGSLIESGMPVGQAYKSVIGTVRFKPLSSSFTDHNERISQGISIGTVMSSIKLFPPYVAPLVSAGYASGALGQSLIRSADIIDREIEHSLKKLTALIEPVMMAGMGCMVGAIALSIMMPIYDISKALQH